MNNNSTLSALVEKQIPKSQLKVGKKLGQGGMAVVYEATTKEGEKVALRQLLGSLRFKFDQKRHFLKGIDLRRNLGRHQNIIQYHGQGTSLMLPYEVIDFCDGEPMKNAIVRKQESIMKDPLLVLRQAAAAMIHIHNCGFIHMDIKPENYFIYVNRDKPVVKLTDFDMCMPSSTRVAPPNTGGTPIYLPLEYFRAKEVSLCTDIFAFGVMAYNLYTFQMPFVGSVMDSADKAGRYEVRFAASQSNRLNDGMKAFITRCLAPTPKERYQNGYELFLALEELHKTEMKTRRPGKNTSAPPSLPPGSSR